MKIVVMSALLLASVQLFAAVVEKALLPEEIELAIHLADTYKVPLDSENGVCTQTKFDVVSRVKGFSPAQWRLVTGENSFKLSSKEIQAMIALVNRVKVPLTVVSSVSSEIRVTIIGGSCGFTPYKWSVSFDDQK
jgi:hypothetical protein